MGSDAAEFDRIGCWMPLPERADNGVRRLAAQNAFVGVRTAISQFEPVTVGVRAALRNCSRAPAEHVRVVDLAHDDSWMRSGPTLYQPSAVWGRRLALQRLGWLNGGLYFPWTRMTWWHEGPGD